MSRFNDLFAKVKIQKRVARIPFLMLGDPTIERSLDNIDAVIKSGADALELGIPFSDPIADGPIVAQASNRARSQGVMPQDCLDMIAQIRRRHPTLPIGLLVYANIVNHLGINHFYALAYKAGIDAVLIPDVPTIEASPFCQAAKENNIHPILIATMNCTDEDLKRVAKLSDGFSYVVTRKGVTGTDKKCEFENTQVITQKLKDFHAPPAVFGFGIKNAQDVQSAYQHGAVGVIIGSALIESLHALSHHPFDFDAVKSLTKNLFGDDCYLAY